ncbi:ATP-grasp domain-containing protein [Streptomyces roseoverticillatus]|uniref:acetyl/propionyl/methylcrotonyl-CoA carboxylase subunit alpha n=1 Tax=Streptomyces roseoverticillatus TaxID=66429 RepID=UPI001F35E22F|nr:biotin carboxylase N-terminal domain-containing protein [Streptomyces roseoverticillatus]MCF3103957.1 ATP-grasp domain-containing protein [Streptomyces roseoverticillatus]
MIGSLLVANRGEIACRVFRTCRELGIASVAVHSDADAGALHVREADVAVRLPGTAAADTYLRGDLVVRAALAAGADAVHPGYGFLSESAAFARAVVDAGLVWIGPPPSVIEAMASKTRAKRIMAEAGVPVLVAGEPPLIVKAAAGGGGRGMRVVRDLAVLDAELASARAEAMAAFGDDEVFVEPYVEGGRHVEVQILADAHGAVWALGTRDCSLQRRHQKVIEEAPAPGLGAGLVEELTEAAVAAARAVGYVGAGTVEFLVTADGRPFFLEMNTRLQVEHPVTEAVYGVDLVARQIRVAEGAALGSAVPVPVGHAVEARLYAEDPGAGWRPQVGVVRCLSVGVRDHVRVDTGFESGDTVTSHYDPLLAKAIAWAPTRPEATRLLARTLERARIHGPVTNRDLLVRSLRHEEFAGARMDTAFYERHLADLTAPRGENAATAALAAAIADAQDRSRFGGWRNLPSQPQEKRYRSEPDGEECTVRYRLTRHGLEAGDGVRLLEASRTHVVLEAGGLRARYDVSDYGDRIHVDGPSGAYAFTPLPRFPDPAAAPAEPGSLLAPMPGTVVRIAEGVAEGAEVHAGQALLWLEAMKMEHRIVSPATGTLTALHAVPGRQVEVGSLLAVVTEEPTP